MDAGAAAAYSGRHALWSDASIDHRRRIMSIVKTTAAVAVAAAALGGGSLALAAGTSKGGKINVFVTQKNPNGAKSQVVITGAIGDYGKGLSTNKNGKVNPNGNYEHIDLAQGSFVVNATGFNKALQHAKPQINRQNCSFLFTGAGPGTLGQGTGAYAGIAGKVTITATFAQIAPRYSSGPHKGMCNESQNAKPLSSYESITGVGHVSLP
jgi:hypothetical protein